MRPSRLLLATAVAAAACRGYAAPVTPTGDVTPPVVAASPAQLESTLFLIGDAGSPAENEPVFAALVKQVLATPGKRVIVFLGDNIYLKGMPDTGGIGRKEAERRIDAQIKVALDTRTETATSSPAITTGATWARAAGTPSGAKATTSTRRARRSRAWCRTADARDRSTWTRVRTCAW